MKKITLVLLICFSVLACNKTNIMKDSTKVTAIAITPQKYDSSWTWKPKFSSTEFCPRNIVDSHLYSDEDRYLDKLIQINLREYADGQYYLDGELYYCPLYRDPNRVPWGEAYGWWVDRSFFYLFATTNEGASLYRNMNTESLEAVVYVTTDGEERLLFKSNSMLARADTLRVQDFGTVVIDDTVFAKAEDFASVLKAHANGTNRVQLKFEAIEGTVFDLNYECTTMPGLRYEITLIVDSTNTIGYVYAVNMGGMVSFELDHRWSIPQR